MSKQIGPMLIGSMLAISIFGLLWAGMLFVPELRVWSLQGMANLFAFGPYLLPQSHS